MAKSTFHFKKFNLQQEHVAHRVGTDSILLGAWSQPQSDCKVMLDIGTGSGVLALMMAQKCSTFESQPKIFAIEPDKVSMKEAQLNFTASSWSSCLHVLDITFEQFVFLRPSKSVDFIICNPPFFTDGHLAPSAVRASARHTLTLTFESLLDGVTQVLSKKGVFSVILPPQSATTFCEKAAMYGLYYRRITEVSTFEGRSVERVLMEFSRDSTFQEKNTLVLMEDKLLYSLDYWSIASEFYLKRKMGN